VTLRLERSPDFWEDIASHPDVAPHVLLAKGIDWSDIVSRPQVQPLAIDDGGFLFVGMDGLGRSFELHALFKPNAWGWPVMRAGVKALAVLAGWDLIVVHEVKGWWRSRPPRSFGFKACSDFHASSIGPVRTWILTRSAWESSPAHRFAE
jgi:hypothetical protein